MAKLHVAPDLALPIDTATSTLSLLAKKGSGKSYTAAVLAEEMLDNNIPIIAVDPTGVWWGLRSSADGKSTGFSVLVMGGEHADLPLDPASGELVARFVVDERPKGLILDLSLMRKADGIRFMLPFIETLYHRNRQAVHLFWDECDLHIPQKPFAEQTRLLGAAEDLVRRGRVKGIGVSLISQRPAVVNKDVLTQTDTLVVLRMVAPQDINAVEAWVKQHDIEGIAPEMLASLPSLPIGDSWWWSPGTDIFTHTRARERWTFDSSRTPKVGEKLTPPKVFAQVDIDRLRTTFAAQIEQAKADDPKTLKRTVDALHHALKVANQKLERSDAGATKADIAMAVGAERKRILAELQPLLKAVEQSAIRMAKATIGEATPALIAHSATIVELHAKVHEKPPPATMPALVEKATERGWTPETTRTVRAVEREKRIPRSAENGELSPGKQAILDAMLELDMLGLEKYRVEQIALLRGVSHTTGTFKQDMRELVESDHIEKVSPGVYTLAQAGLDAAVQHDDRPRSLTELHTRWLNTVDRMSKPRGDILRHIINVSEQQPIRVEDLAKALGKSHTTGTFKHDIRTLANLQLIRRDRGVIEPTDVLFPHGR